MKQEILEVIKKYIDIDEKAIDVRLTNKEGEDGKIGAPALYANIPIITIKNEARKLEGSLKKEDDTTKEDKKVEESKEELEENNKQENTNNIEENIAEEDTTINISETEQSSEEMAEEQNDDDKNIVKEVENEKKNS